MLSRRQFLASLAAVAAGGVGADAESAARKTVIDVKALGATGDGKGVDLGFVRKAIAVAARQQGGATVFFPAGEYYLGEVDASFLLPTERLQNVRFLGQNATLSCRTVRGESYILSLAGCRNIDVEGLAFRDYGADRNVKRHGAISINITDIKRVGCENIRITDCVFDSVLSGITCVQSTSERIRCRNIALTNLSVSHSYYGFNFAENGDDVTGRGLRCNDVKRSYFPYGVSNHDIELETSNNATRFEDCLIKCYQGDTSDLRLKVKCRGKRGGDAIVSLDQQHENGHGLIHRISLSLDFDDADCRLEAAVLFRSLTPDAKIERRTTNRWDEISIDGNVRICDRTKLIGVISIPDTAGRISIGPGLAHHPQLSRTLAGFTVTQSRS
jgi:hypothetical protein